MNEDEAAQAGHGAPAAPAFGRAGREAFLAHLAETSNVRASARIAGITPALAYRERRRSAAFRDAWARALAEGYVRLEGEMLAEALRRPNGRASDATMKAQAARVRLGMALLGHHAASVRGDRRPAAAATAALPGRKPRDVRARLEARFAEMRARAADNDDDEAEADAR